MAVGEASRQGAFGALSKRLGCPYASGRFMGNRLQQGLRSVCSMLPSIFQQRSLEQVCGVVVVCTYAGAAGRSN